ncbi:MAG: glycogen synthase [Ruminococcaceae bacterium]|nr:glycogen synthase [Oscillospiraceae bacterium]
MKILYVTSEANPYAASGGLGDVLGALPITVAEDNPDSEVGVIMPLYSTMKAEYVQKLEKVKDITFKYGWRDSGASIYKIRNGKVDYYFVENHYYFERGRLYGEFDDAERFAYFSLAVIEFMIQCGNIPDILHANDWQTALSVVYLKTKFACVDSLKHIRTVYTIHNIEYQGKFDSAILGDIFALDGYSNVLEYNGCINLMKGAISTSDYITTVSPNYAYELRHDFFAFGLADIIHRASAKMKGVINGIDYRYFSPETGGDIYYSYGLDDVKEGKLKNKLALQREVGLPERADVPLVVMITRLATAKGIDLVSAIIDELLRENMQFILLGTGEAEYENFFRELEKRHDNVKSLIKFDRVISKKMYAAADIFIMPSKSEPCGLAQMIACSYGTVPVVRAVGGLFDSIKPYGTDGENGFTFDNYNAHELLFTVKRALDLYKDTEKWDALVLKAKRSDFSWKISADKYMRIYKKLMEW